MLKLFSPNATSDTKLSGTAASLVHGAETRTMSAMRHKSQHDRITNKHTSWRWRKTCLQEHRPVAGRMIHEHWSASNLHGKSLAARPTVLRGCRGALRGPLVPTRRRPRPKYLGPAGVQFSSSYSLYRPCSTDRRPRPADIPVAVSKNNMHSTSSGSAPPLAARPTEPADSLLSAVSPSLYTSRLRDHLTTTSLFCYYQSGRQELRQGDIS